MMLQVALSDSSSDTSTASPLVDASDDQDVDLAEQHIFSAGIAAASFLDLALQWVNENFGKDFLDLRE